MWSGGEGFTPDFPPIFIWTIFPHRILFFFANMTDEVVNITSEPHDTYALETAPAQ